MIRPNCTFEVEYWFCNIKLYCSIFFFEQKEIHKSDGSTLEGHRVTDGSTVNVMAKPEQFIIINLKCGPKTYTKNVSSSRTARQLKEQLMNAGVVAFSIDEFKLRKFLNVDGAVNKTMLLDDDSLSLYHYGVQNEAKFTVIGPYIRLNIVNTESKRSSRMFSKWSSLLEVKRILASVHHFDFNIFVKRRNNVYRKLNTAHDIPVDRVLKDGDTIYLSKNDFFRSYCRLYFNGSEVGNFGFGGESVLSIKLRNQLLTGVPVRNINIMWQPLRARTANTVPHQVSLGQSENNYAQEPNVNGYIATGNQAQYSFVQQGAPPSSGNLPANGGARDYAIMSARDPNSKAWNSIDHRYPDDRILSGSSTCYIEIV